MPKLQAFSRHLSMSVPLPRMFGFLSVSRDTSAPVLAFVVCAVSAVEQELVGSNAFP